MVSKLSSASLTLLAIASLSKAAGSLPEKYNLSLILPALIILYAASWLASKKGILSIPLHRKIWNIFLLVSFLAVAVFSIDLVVMINYGAKNPLPLDVRFWHVEIGMAMVIIAVFHILWHISYFQAYLPKMVAKKKETASQKEPPILLGDKKE